MSRLTALIREDREYKNFASAFVEAMSATKPLPIAVNGLSGGAEDAFLIESVSDAISRGVPVLIMAGDEPTRDSTAARLAAAGIECRVYKRRELVFHNIKASREIDRERLSVLSAILAGECSVVVTTPAAALGYTIPQGVIADLTVTLRGGYVVEPRALAEKLVTLGFLRVDGVDGVGQFAMRGGILDLWSAEAELPVRIEFFGDEIDRMVYFDPISQRSEGVCEEVRLLPARELLISSDARERILAEAKKLLKKAKDSEITTRLTREIATIEAGLSLDFGDRYMGLVYDKQECLFDYLSGIGHRAAIFMLGTSACADNAKKSAENLESEAKSLVEMGVATTLSAKYTAPVSTFDDFCAENLTIHLNAFAGGVTGRLSGLFGFRCRRTLSYGDNANMLAEDLRGLRKGGYRTVLVSENRVGAESVIAALAEADIAAIPIYDNPDFNISAADTGSVMVDIGDFQGFDLIAPRIAVLSMARDEGKRIMANRRRQRILRKSGGAGKRIMSHADLSVGDYVVHANYGIGLFEGIQAVSVDGVTKDYITIRYAGTDKLFVPCDKLEQIGKYIGARDKNGEVKLSRMGGTDWQRTKSRAKGAAKDIAKELIAIYAERQRRPGFAFPADSDLEDEFAAAFEYEETDSQLQAIDEIKRDMMRPVPMNRLLCGDVGYGKTEVALRAAFKAIMGGKQVAILVPTTILALQHYQTAISRMRGYPVTIEMLSRFKTPKQQSAIIRKVKRGECDILIGTHKLLSKNIEFRDLGLVIIDEEQRFGVSQKEKLKEAVKNVDVLTLSATPIPRTLNMAMNGISDMSVLDEAPGDRRPVQTYVLEHDEGVVFDAIAKELSRGGQVLYVYNKVDDIDLVAGRIMSALPEARVAFAHGQMEREEIEDIWQGLVRGEIDVLVSTTIIETGVDLPNANTLIIENADRFGLSQLHQIRGRVGRSERQAYAYFTYRRGKTLTEIAEKRLSAIRDFAEFGAGFNIALRDLEIRGAGNLLGAEQHGYIESIGYDLYIKLLNEAVLEEQGATSGKKVECTVDIRVDAHIPEYYISVSAQRMDMYKKISLIETAEDASDVTDEFIDRFGEMPRVVERLVSVALIKAIAERAGIRRVEEQGGTLSFISDTHDLAVWSEVFERHRGLTFRGGVSPSVAYRLKSGEDAIRMALAIMQSYDEEKNKDEKNDGKA
ncbi:MAG: transcription-repair coupling factor [Clostridia bacterium]|nr:transcription-repair coupling factor [Clostridia bacterium]